MIYYFHDSDRWGNTTYDICGEEYKTLIQLCCKYANVVSFDFKGQNTPIEQYLLTYAIDKPSLIPASSIRYFLCSSSNANIPLCTKRYFRVCPELCNFLSNAVTSIWQWQYWNGNDNPTDPAFYRDDGSIFFSSVIHDGICTLNLRDGENASKVLTNPLWIVDH